MHVIVESLIMTTILILGFAYDRWRSGSDTFTIYEHYAVVFIISMVLMIVVYHVAHGVRVGGERYASPIHVATCVAGMCEEGKGGGSGSARAVNGGSGSGNA